MKYQIDYSKLENIIENSDFLFDSDEEKNNEIRRTMKSLVRELGIYTNKSVEFLHKKLYEKESDYSFGEVVNALVPIKDAKDIYYEFSGIDEFDDSKLIFIDTDYDSMREIVGDDGGNKVYSGKYKKDGKSGSFQYKLRYDGLYNKIQEYIYRLDEIYTECVKYPIVYAPYSKKTFKIHIIDGLPSEVDEIDYEFDKNDIPCVEGHVLLWNIKYEKTDVLVPDLVQPYGGINKYIYSFKRTKDGRLPIAIPCDNQVVVYNFEINEDEVKLYINKDMTDFILIYRNDVDWDRQEIKILNKQGRIYTNAVSDDLIRPRQIISKGDVEYAINPYRNGYMSCELSSEDELKSIVTRYGAKYKTESDNKIRHNKKTRVYLRFQSDRETDLVNDYVNYILDCLDYAYPEIEWVGGV